MTIYEDKGFQTYLSIKRVHPVNYKDSPQFLADILRYHDMRQELRDMKKKEMELRLQIISKLPPEGYGTVSYHFGEVQGKIKRSLSYSLDQESISDQYDQMTDEEKSCLRVKYELNRSVYNKSSIPVAVNLNKHITVRDAAPTIDVIFQES